MFAITVNSSPIFTVFGNGGSMRVKPNISLNPGDGGHVESLYVLNDSDSFLEFGWLVGPAFGQSSPILFSFRSHNGSTDLRQLDVITGGDHRIWFWRHSADGWWHHRSDFASYGHIRNPPWSSAGGRLMATGEIHNQCDSGSTRWWALQYFSQAAQNWINWTDNMWECDQMTHWGYDHLSNLEFSITSRTDTFTGCR